MVMVLFSYENTVKSALYTYDVDVCFAAVLAAKLGFPWIYEYLTGNNCTHNETCGYNVNTCFANNMFSVFQAVGLISRSGEADYDYYGTEEVGCKDLKYFCSKYRIFLGPHPVPVPVLHHGEGFRSFQGDGQGCPP